MTRPIVMGLGSPHGDDQAGWLVVDFLERMGYPSERLRRLRHPAEMLDHFAADETYLVCDACRGSESQRVARWIWPDERLRGLHGRGTHDMAVSDVLELARTLQRCPPTVEVWAVAGDSWEPNAPPRAEVFKAARDVAETILKKHAHA